ncbi:hypothetical protein SO802_018762 [Lithocarpus litseifolius]|uniref:Bifunctional inhibitor/plant lipid transfer protein/seed storage helical domain-containing protein n=1 Tax=Lithocarpus litseifolius TaxID=425828 RepID=A0AAW2CLW4_9ROSI
MTMATAKVFAMVAASVILFSAFFHSVSAQAEAPGSSPASASAPAVDPCLNNLLNLTDCLTFVEAGSNATKPDKGCCPELAGLIESNPICLCELLGGNLTESYGFNIDVKRALKLPSLCGLKTPPVSTCSALGYAVPGPVGGPSPSESPGAEPAAHPTSGKNGASSNLGFTLAFTVGLAIAFLQLFF